MAMSDSRLAVVSLPLIVWVSRPGPRCPCDPGVSGTMPATPRLLAAIRPQLPVNRIIGITYATVSTGMRHW